MKAPRRSHSRRSPPVKVKVLDGPRRSFDGVFFRTTETPDGGLQVEMWDKKAKQWIRGGTLTDLMEIPFALRRDLDVAGIPHGPEDLPPEFPTEEEDARRAKNNDEWMRALRG